MVLWLRRFSIFLTRTIDWTERFLRAISMQLDISHLKVRIIDRSVDSSARCSPETLSLPKLSIFPAAVFPRAIALRSRAAISTVHIFYKMEATTTVSGVPCFKWRAAIASEDIHPEWSAPSFVSVQELRQSTAWSLRRRRNPLIRP